MRVLLALLLVSQASSFAPSIRPSTPLASFPKTSLSSPISTYQPLFSAEPSAPDTSTGAPDASTGTSMTASTFNVIKACVGSGVLSLPSAIAAVTSNKLAVIPATAAFATLGALSAYSFYLIGKLCEMTKATSLEEIWSKSVNDRTKYIIGLACFITPLGAALSYSIILGDTTALLATTVGLPSLTRNKAILGLSACVLYPLTLMKDLAKLAPVSMVGVAGIVTTAIFMVYRALGSYAANTALTLSLTPALRPAFTAAPFTLLQPSALILIAMAATSFLCHFNAPDFYNQLASPSTKRFKKLSILGFGLTFLFSAVMMSAGFLTWGSASAGVILNNYSTGDVGATLCRFLTAVSVVGSYPFIFSAMRDSFLRLIGSSTRTPTGSVPKGPTIAMMSALTGASLVLKNAGFVVSFNGAIMGSAIIYMFPSIMYLSLTKKRLAAGTMADTGRLRRERTFNKVMIAFGIATAACGGTVTVLDAFVPMMLK